MRGRALRPTTAPVEGVFARWEELTQGTLGAGTVMKGGEEEEGFRRSTGSPRGSGSRAKESGPGSGNH